MPDDREPTTAEPDATAPGPGDEQDGGDAPVTSPGAWTAIAAPGKPDGEVDTRG